MTQPEKSYSAGGSLEARGYDRAETLGELRLITALFPDDTRIFAGDPAKDYGEPAVLVTLVAYLEPGKFAGERHLCIGKEPD